jgi:acyl-homoserine-lactone acylase
VARLRAAAPYVVEGHPVEPAALAAVLEAWDGTFTLAAPGAVLWRELMAGFSATAWKDAGPLFEVAFDPDDPVATPHTLARPADGAPSADPVLAAAGHASRVLAAAGLAPDAALAAVQWAARGDRRVPVPGGGEGEGVLNVLAPTGALPPASLEPMPEPPLAVPGREGTGLGHGGYQVTYGASFLMAVELTPAGPQGLGLLAYGQSGDPRSVHHADGTEAYAAGAVRPLRFTDADIAADPELRTVRLRSTDRPSGSPG